MTPPFSVSGARAVSLPPPLSLALSFFVSFSLLWREEKEREGREVHTPSTRWRPFPSPCLSSLSLKNKKRFAFAHQKRKNKQRGLGGRRPESLLGPSFLTVLSLSFSVREKEREPQEKSSLLLCRGIEVRKGE